MKIDELAKLIGAQLYSLPGQSCGEVTRVHASDTMSSLIANASADTLLVTSLNNNQLVRVAELMGAPGLCLVGGAEPCPELLSLARTTGAAIVVSPHGLDETRRLIESRLSRVERPGA